MTKEQFEKAKELYARRDSHERILKDYKCVAEQEYFGKVTFQHIGYEPIDLHVSRDLLIDFIKGLNEKHQKAIDDIDKEIAEL